MILSVLFITACAKSGPAVKTEEKDGEVVVGEDGTKIVELNCDKNMKDYAVANTPVEFCYDPAWGAVKVQENNPKTGTSFMVTFEKEGSPSLLFDSLDLNFGDVDFAPYSFMLINPTLKEELIKDGVEKFYNDRGLSEKVKISNVRKSDVAGVRAVRVEFAD